VAAIAPVGTAIIATATATAVSLCTRLDIEKTPVNATNLNGPVAES
jgi:hypothetical protein